MRKRTLKIIIITLSILLTFFVFAGLFVCRRTTPPLPPEPDPVIVEPTPAPPPEVIEITSIRVLLENDVLVIGSRFWPEVIIQPYNASDNTYELRSDNERIVRKQGNSWIAAGLGRTTITVTTAGGVTASAHITVVTPELESLAFQDEEITILLEDHVDAVLTLTPPNANIEGQLRFISANERIATVSNEGRITAVGVGTTTITAAVGNVRTEIKVHVVVPISRIVIDVDRQERLTYSVGDQVEFRVHTEPESVSNDSITISFIGAQITSTGTNTFRCDAAGEVTIIGTAEGGVSGSVTIVVHDLTELADEVFRLTNLERSNHVPPSPALNRSAPLTQVAQFRAGEIIIYIDADHRRPDGREWSTILDDYGIERGPAGENLAAGPRSPAEVVRAWMESPLGHGDNIVNVEFGRMGVGVAMDGTGRLYWVQLFTD